MVRKQIYITEDQQIRLKNLASVLKTTEANLVREGLELILTRPLTLKNHDAWKKEWKFISSLLRKRSVKGKRAWRRDDLYDR